MPIKMKNVPLIGTEYIYTGKDTEDHKHGSTYRVVETGDHWIKESGFVVWITTEEYKDTWDADYCRSFDLQRFHSLFWKT